MIDDAESSLLTVECLSVLDEDRLSKRKSIGDIVSLQIDMDAERCPDKHKVCLSVCLSGGLSNGLAVCLMFFVCLSVCLSTPTDSSPCQPAQTEQITFETLKSTIGT